MEGRAEARIHAADRREWQCRSWRVHTTTDQMKGPNIIWVVIMFVIWIFAMHLHKQGQIRELMMSDHLREGLNTPRVIDKHIYMGGKAQAGPFAM